MCWGHHEDIQMAVTMVMEKWLILADFRAGPRRPVNNCVCLCGKLI